MKKIGLLSDTHSFIDPKIYEYFKDVDEIWHAGDIGSMEVIEKLNEFKPTKAVFGNIDDHQIRKVVPEFNRFYCEEMQVLITHIAGKPGKYVKTAFDEIVKNPPDIFVCGHSHILLIQMDKRFNMLWMNPGACGYKGFHQVKTIVRFSVNGKKIENLEVIEIGKRA